MFCPYCGTHVKDDSEFCKHCGKNISPGAEASTSFIKTTEIIKEPKIDGKTIAKTKKKSMIFVIIGSILFVIGLYVSIVHKSLAVGMVGRDQIVKEAFIGGSSLNDAVTLILGISMVFILLGAGLLLYGLIPILKKK